MAPHCGQTTPKPHDIEGQQVPGGPSPLPLPQCKQAGLCPDRTVGYGRVQGRDGKWTTREEALLPSHAGAADPDRWGPTPALPLSGSPFQFRADPLSVIPDTSPSYEKEMVTIAKS